MTPNKRANFGSKLGAILAAAGSAVGLGNIWRFPYETGEHGGAAFILVYIGYVLLAGLLWIFARRAWQSLSMPHYRCGRCGCKLRRKGVCPRCGAVNE